MGAGIQNCRFTPHIVCAAIALILAAAAAIAEPVNPPAIRVIDGDTIEARGLVIRLIGFDTPESRARCAKASAS